MDNAAKALLIAGGVLITIIVVNVGILLMKNTAENASEFYSIMDEHEIMEFNEQFTRYQDREYLTMQDVVSIMNLAKNYNESNGYNFMNDEERDKYCIFVEGYYTHASTTYTFFPIFKENNQTFENKTKELIKSYVSNGYNELSTNDDKDKTKPKKYFEIKNIEYDSSQLVKKVEIKQVDND